MTDVPCQSHFFSLFLDPPRHHADDTLMAAAEADVASLTVDWGKNTPA